MKGDGDGEGDIPTGRVDPKQEMSVVLAIASAAYFPNIPWAAIEYVREVPLPMKTTASPVLSCCFLCGGEIKVP
jgi:hypothetical protein